jgi:NADP-dependent 3-hydroxy acid dehydrogenase YdfG
MVTEKSGFAASFARAGAAGIALLGRSTSKLGETEKLVKDINPQTKVLSIAVDVTDEAGMEDAFQKIVYQLVL